MFFQKLEVLMNEIALEQEIEKVLDEARNDFEVTWDVTLETFWYSALKKFAKRIEELVKTETE